MTHNIIETFDLSKEYKLKGRKKVILALNKVNISIKEGEVFGLLGPNGAGKTTLIQILTTLIQPTSGYAIIDGYNIIKSSKKARAQISLMLGSSMLYNRITGYSNLKFFCKMYNVSNYEEKINKISKDFGLDKWLNQYTGQYSSGMRMKLALCRTLLLDRKLLFLDEPTLGLDVNTKSFIINKLKNINGTIFLTSHDMGMVEKLCDRVAFINNGNILKIGNKEFIKKLEQAEINLEVEINESKSQLKSELIQLKYINKIDDTKLGFIINFRDRENYKDLLLKLSMYNILKIKEKEISLEDLFLSII